MKEAKRKRDTLKMRTLAAIDLDRAERNYRRQEDAYRAARRSGLLAHIVEALKGLVIADDLWLKARRRGMMVEAIWRS